MKTLTHDETLALFLKEKLVAIARTQPLDQLALAAKALVKGGVKLLEITLDQREADPEPVLRASMDAVRRAVGDDLALGCGTVLNPDQLQMALRAGAAFYLSPNCDPAVVKAAREAGIVAIPGAMTPTEIVAAWSAGADIVKLFPADDLGDHYVWNLKGPLPHIPLLASGGVNPDTIPKYLKEGFSAVGTGVTIFDRELLSRGDYDGIERLARRHVEAVRQAEA